MLTVRCHHSPVDRLPAGVCSQCHSSVYSLKHSIGSVDGADRVREAGRLCDSCRLNVCRVRGPQGPAEMFEGPGARS